MMVPRGPACAQTAQHCLQLQIRQFSPVQVLLQVKKNNEKNKKGGGEEEEKENTVQTLLWPNLALLRKENFPEPHSTNLET